MVRGAGSRKGKESDMYTFDSRVRYSETGEEGLLSLPAIVDYFQDVSTFQSEDLGIGIDFLKKIGYNSNRNFMRLYNRNESKYSDYNFR